MTAFYNEIDPKTAAWLRELIKRNLIAPGVVDERSIVDIRPTELAGYTQCHFFAGVGVWSYALRRAGWPDDRPVWTGSCPCQPFSVAGEGKGFADERHLWPAWFHLISQCRPRTVFGEQVAGEDGNAWLDLVSTDMEAIGYAFGAPTLPAAGFGAPHGRHRIFFVADTTSNGHAATDGLREAAEPPEPPEQERIGQPERSSNAGDMADTSSRGLGINGSAPRDTGHADEREPTSTLGDAAEPRCEGNVASTIRRGRNPRGQDARPTGSGTASLVGNAEQPRLEGHSGNGHRGHEPRRLAENENGSTAQAGGTERMDYTTLDGRESGEQLHRKHDGQIADDGRVAGPTKGFWRDAIWIPCRDGKYRPTQSGIAPLVAGAPARVVRLRGYGNAINAVVAEEFIKAYIETERER